VRLTFPLLLPGVAHVDTDDTPQPPAIAPRLPRDQICPSVIAITIVATAPPMYHQFRYRMAGLYFPSRNSCSPVVCLWLPYLPLPVDT
jgi:hypothetical protein